MVLLPLEQGVAERKKPDIFQEHLRQREQRWASPGNATLNRLKQAVANDRALLDLRRDLGSFRGHRRGALPDGVSQLATRNPKQD